MAKQEENSENNIKLLTYQEIKSQTGLHLSEQQLVIIDNVYVLHRKSAVFKVLMYRLINFVIAVLFFVFYYFSKGTKFEEWVFIISTSIFAMYNMIHLWNNIVDYKTTKVDNFKGMKFGHKI